MNDHTRSLEVARTMLRGAVWAVRTEMQRGACEERQRLAMQNVVFWRERFEALWRARVRNNREAGRPVGDGRKVEKSD
ncbi:MULTISPECIES: hypothetical protein [Ramlibacter]|jgi:hypothetical protein|uniref:Uncharacterized protein n=1 Tax=Ramlibacter pinisoli TaxID=2682844 RepID=A0A6N8IQ16_9BURK|nr:MULTISPECIES: hypothetical protein [Ramlibacter]MBA2963846.1 hypothetical protein [Ramlibacter sp. CGMCC 1.13660]MVQ28812.1 hypothetical protein [Ramlibacter pinisoli]